MANTDTFSGYHPTVNFIYFALVLFFGMIFMHPACLAIALFGAAAYAVRLKGRKAAGFGVKFILPVVLLAVVINPVFNHAGETVLAYLSNGNPITKESIAYGFAAGAMLYVVVEELIPEASEGNHSNLGTIGFGGGFAMMMVLDVVMG